MMKLLDRYLLTIFLAALAVFLIAFVSLFMVIDMASKMARFLELKDVSTLAFMGRYYLVRLPMVFAYLLPTIVLFASIFTVIKLSRTNELLPMVTAGTSLRRVTAPFVVTAVAGSLTMGAMDEFVLPRVGEEITRTDIALSNQEAWGVTVYDKRTFLYAWRYDPLALRMEDVQATVFNDEARPAERLKAELCLWEPARSRWIAYRGTVEKFGQMRLLEGERPKAWIDPIPADGHPIPSPFPPDQVRKRASWTSRFPFDRFEDLLREAREFPHIPSTRMKIYSRLAFPLSPVILLLLALPFVTAATSKSYLKGLFFCFLLALAYYLMHLFCLEMGNRGAIPAIFAGWFPTALFGGAGVAAFARMRT